MTRTSSHKFDIAQQQSQINVLMDQMHDLAQPLAAIANYLGAALVYCVKANGDDTSVNKDKIIELITLSSQQVVRAGTLLSELQTQTAMISQQISGRDDN